MGDNKTPSESETNPPQNTADLTAFVQNLLQQMQARFQTMSDSIISRIDEMGGRIDELEKSIGELIKEAGAEAPQINSSHQPVGPPRGDH
jgi:heat shock factor-binding protein 1